MVPRDNRRSTVIDSVLFESSTAQASWSKPSKSQDAQPGDRSNETPTQIGGGDEKDASEVLAAYLDNQVPHTIEDVQQDESPEQIPSAVNAMPGDSDRGSWATAYTHVSTFHSQRQSGSIMRSSKPSTRPSWRTAWSNVSRDDSLNMGSFYSAESSVLGIAPSPKRIASESSWMEHMRSLQLVLDPSVEQNWSGRGQHAEFSSEEEVPLQVEAVLGYGTALVESVRCRRIRLARKTINCSFRLQKEDAVKEVAHLQRLQHTHIIQVVGTYVCGRKLSILLYPVAEYTLDVFMDKVRDSSQQSPTSGMQSSFETFFSCLGRAVAFIHKNLVKHMDIKPKNILVKRNSEKTASRFPNSEAFKIIIADFGISRSYTSVTEVCTESPTSFTRTYAAPEVIDQAPRDFSADIFSLGCVLVEMLATLDGFRFRKYILGWMKKRCNIFSEAWLVDFRQQKHFKRLYDIIPDTPETYQTVTSYDGLAWIRRMNTDHDMSYQANAKTIIAWLSHRNEIETGPVLVEDRLDFVRLYQFTDLICAMLNQQSALRPSSSQLENFFNGQDVFPICDCGSAPDPYETADG